MGLPARPGPKESGSGSVAIISEYTGTIARRWPGSCGIASVARMTYLARTVPDGVTSRGLDRRHRGALEDGDPLRRTASASPRTSLAGWMAAQCGVYVPPSTPVAATRSVASARSAASGHRSRSRLLASAASAVARSSCAAERASCTCRPWPSGSRCPRPRPPRPRPRCPASPAAWRSPRPGRPSAPACRARRGTAPSTSRRFFPRRRSRRSRARRRRSAGRVRAGQVVGRPQPGVARPGDGHVDLDIPGQPAAGASVPGTVSSQKESFL